MMTLLKLFKIVVIRRGDKARQSLNPFGMRDHVILTTRRELATALQARIRIDHHDARHCGFNRIVRAPDIGTAHIRPTGLVNANARDLHEATIRGTPSSPAPRQTT
ncbi:MAG: hypothetical protein AAFY22_15210, partial [Pseudomonadota bacterium]